MNQEKIGKFIARCRKEKNMTQNELAEKLGVTDKSIGNWENARCMPDLSLFKPLCKELDISINDFISGERISKENYQEKFEENIINTIDYSNKKVSEKNSIIGIILIAFGIVLAITAMSIFPSESSWGSIYSVFGCIISLIGISRFTKRLSYTKRLIFNFGYFILFICVLFVIDYIGVVNIHQAPRFSLEKTTINDGMYYDTPFYDVVGCYISEENESFKIIKNQQYSYEKMNNYCK